MDAEATLKNALLSAAWLHGQAPQELRTSFRDWIESLRISRIRALEKADCQERRELDLRMTTDIIRRREELIDSDFSKVDRSVFDDSTIMFHFETCLRDGIIESETEGFFDLYETPHPAYWVDFKTHRPPDVPYARSILVSWFPRELCERFEDIQRLSCTGELMWLSQALDDPELTAIARDYAKALNALK